MTTFTVHDKTSAPAASVPLIEKTERAYGFLPNLIATFAEAPATAEGYLSIGSIFDKTSFSPSERQVVLLAASRVNECHYCLAAHTVVAGMQQVPRDVVDAIREDRPIADAKLEALRRFTVAVVEKRGWVDDADIESFAAAGYGNQQVLEVVLGVAMKTISNYTNHVAETPLDDAFAAEAWQPVENRAAG